MQNLRALVTLDLLDCLSIDGEKCLENLTPDDPVMLPVILKLVAGLGKVDLGLATSEISLDFLEIVIQAGVVSVKLVTSGAGFSLQSSSVGVVGLDKPREGVALWVESLDLRKKFAPPISGQF